MRPTQQILEVGCRLVETGLSDGTSGNISVRCAERSHILITPSGRDFRLLTERDLVRVDLETGTQQGSGSHPANGGSMSLSTSRGPMSMRSSIITPRGPLP